LSINVTNPKVGKTLLPADIHITGPLAEDDRRRVRFEQDPLLKEVAPVKRQPSRKLRTKAFEPVCATRACERDRLCDVQGIFHKIRRLRTGFEV
jgi:hypothetical protein